MIQRPNVDLPEYNKEGMQTIKKMAREYKDAKTRVMVYPKKRPTLMKQLQVKLEDYDGCGLIEYDEEKFREIPLEDQDYILQYAADLQLIFVLEKVIAAISNEKTRMIAEDTLLRGKSCKELVGKYGLKEVSIRNRRMYALRTLSLLV